MRTYDPTQHTVTFKGTTIDGFSDGTFIKASRNGDGFTIRIGNSGSGGRSKNPDKSGTFEITLLYGAPANGLLSAIATADEESSSGVGEFSINDRNTAAAEAFAQNAWIKKMPDMERAKEIGEVTWIFETDNMNIVHDGMIDVAST